MSFALFFEVATAVAVASIPYCFTKWIEIRANKQKLKEDARKLKEEYYFDYVDNFVDATRNDKDADENTKKVIKEACAKLSHVHNRILLIGSSAVVKNMREHHDHCEAIAKAREKIDAKFSELLTELVKSMRIDLYEEDKKFNLFFFELCFKPLCNKNINKNYPTINFIGKK